MKQIIFLCCAVFLIDSCVSITNYFPKQTRPFQQREFNSEQWKSGDYQTRGEMTDAKLLERISQIESNTQEQIIELLGKPDEKTKARCCYAGRSGQSGEVDLWLYYIEIEGWAKDTKTKPPIEKKALKIYFDGTGVSRKIGDRDSDHDYFPAIGYLNRLN